MYVYFNLSLIIHSFEVFSVILTLCFCCFTANGSDHPGDQDLMPHLLKSLVSHAGEQLGKNLVELLLQGGSQASGLLAVEQAPQEDLKQAPQLPRQELYSNGTSTGNRSEKQARVNDFDLNDIYIDSDDGTDIERSSPPPTNPATSSPDYPSWIHQTSPPQTTRNSDSASDQSPSSSSEDAQVYESLTASSIVVWIHCSLILTFFFFLSDSLSSDAHRPDCVQTIWERTK